MPLGAVSLAKGFVYAEEIPFFNSMCFLCRRRAFPLVPVFVLTGMFKCKERVGLRSATT